MFGRKKTRKSKHGDADCARDTPTMCAAKALRADPSSTLFALEDFFGRQAQITVYLRERRREGDINSNTSSSSTSTATSSSPSAAASAHRSPFEKAHEAHMTRSRLERTPDERRAADHRQRRRVRHRRARLRNRVYSKRDLLWAYVQIGPGGDTGKSPEGCLTHAEAIESAALAFLVKLAAKERAIETADDSSGVDSTLETSLRSTTSSPSPRGTPRMTALATGTAHTSASSQSAIRRPHSARGAASSAAPRHARRARDMPTSTLARSTSDVLKMAQLKRSQK